jgi:hypothetical protein
MAWLAEGRCPTCRRWRSMSASRLERRYDAVSANTSAHHELPEVEPFFAVLEVGGNGPVHGGAFTSNAHDTWLKARDPPPGCVTSRRGRGTRAGPTCNRTPCRQTTDAGVAPHKLNSLPCGWLAIKPLPAEELMHAELITLGPEGTHADVRAYAVTQGCRIGPQ